jgi:hypothetical protein
VAARSARRRYAGALSLLVICAGCIGAEPAGAAPPEVPCGAATTATVTNTVVQVAQRIYQGEISSPEVRADRRQVEEDGPLLSALAAGDRVAVAEAVRRLVYSGTHIVRLRVVSNGAVLSDIGGPYILAPVSGTLRSGGRTVGRYILSVQDDLGYVKLESRFIGLPLILRTGGHPIALEGALRPGSKVPAHGPMRYAGRRYETVSLPARAFLGEALTITLLVPLPPPSTASCAQVMAGELGRVAHTVWNRVVVIGARVSAYVPLLRGLTGGQSYVRAGSHQLAGSTSPGPRRIPDSGSLTYRGVNYLVASFVAHTGGQSVRVYQLTPV